MLTNDSKKRKEIPLARGCLDYFPLALAAVAELSRAGNEKHNPGQPLHWSREKSSDHADCIVRHLIDRGKIDAEDGILHDVKVAWRALAMAQMALEKQEKGLSGPIPGQQPDPWVDGYRDWANTKLRFPAGPKVPSWNVA